MSDSVFAFTVKLILFSATLAWLPLLHLCRRCHRRIFRRTLPVLGVGLSLVVMCSTAFGQFAPGFGIVTVAGNVSGTGFVGDGGPAISSELSKPYGIVRDQAGNLYIADSNNERVRKIDTAGNISTVAGNGGQGYSGDGGAATAAQLNTPTDVAVNAAGDLFIADLNNNVIRKVSAVNGKISTVAGNNASGSSGDGGPATGASLNHPVSIVLDSAGNLYIADEYNSVIREVSVTTGRIDTVVGNHTQGYAGDGGSAASAQLNAPVSVRFDAAGNLYVSDIGAYVVRKVTAANNTITTVVGNGTNGTGGDGGVPTHAQMSCPGLTTVDNAGNLYVVDTCARTVREVVAATGFIQTVAGNRGVNGTTANGVAAVDAAISPYGILTESSGLIDLTTSCCVSTLGPLSPPPPTQIGSHSGGYNLVLQTTTAETINSFSVPVSLGNKQEYNVTSSAFSDCVADGKTLNPAGTVCTFSIDFYPAYPGLRSLPLQIMTSAGNFNAGLNGMGIGPLAALTPGIGTTIAGTGISGNTGDSGQATSAKIGSPFLATDGVGNIYFADSSFQVVRRIDALTGVITKVAGTGVMGYSGDGGSALQATFSDVQAVTVDSSGNLYIADSVACVVRKITAATGIITTVAGNGTTGHSGIGGLAVNAQLCPNSLTVDAAGNLYIVDQGNSSGTAGDWVLKVTASTGILSVVAGTGSAGYSGDGGPATAAALKVPSGVALDSANNVYISDSHNNVLRKVNAMTGIITTIAGNGTYGFLGDGGPATSAEMEFPRAITLDSAGDIYFGDCCTYTVRKIDAATGTIRTVAGGGTSSNDGVPATTQGYSYVNAVALDGAGNLYIGDFDARIHKVSVATTTLTFPTSTAIGSLDPPDDPQTALFSNIGNAPLNGFSGNGAITASWLIDATSTCFPFSPVASGASCTLPVDFKPTQSGAPLTGTLTMLDTSLNAQPSTQTINLVGTATGGTSAAGVLTITPSPITFTTTAGVAAPSQNVTLTNIGTATLGIRSVGISGANQSAFQASLANLCPTIAVGASCSEPVSLLSTTFGSYSAFYDVTYYPVTTSTSTTIISAPLSGTVHAAVAGVLTITPSPISFTTTAGVTAPSQNVTLTNTGTATLGIRSVGISGANQSAFQASLANLCPTIAVSASCSEPVSFVSTNTGSYSASYDVTYYPVTGNITTAITSAPLTGTVTGAPIAELSPASLTFNAPANTAAGTQPVTLSNTGTAPLNIASIALGGTNALSFSIVNNPCGSSLMAGGNCVITVGFPAAAIGSYTATLVLNAPNANPVMQVVLLQATVTAPPDFTLTATPAAQSSYLGTTVSYQLAIAPVASTNPYNTAINLTASGLPLGVTATFAPASVTPGAATVGSVMTIAIPALRSSNDKAPFHGRGRASEVLSATLLIALAFTGNRRLRRKLRAMRTLMVLALAGGLCLSITGCAPGTGFAVPQSTSTITITGTSGTLVHSATVTLTLK
jgi:hypothetical protein